MKMELKIIGSAGTNTIPKLYCNCDLCVQARRKGMPYKRRSSSFFIKELDSVFEIPNDLRYSLNFELASLVKNLFVTSQNLESFDGLRLLSTIISLKRKSGLVKSIKSKKLRLFLPFSFNRNPAILDWIKNHISSCDLEVVFVEIGKSFELNKCIITPFKINLNNDLGFVIYNGNKTIVIALHTIKHLRVMENELNAIMAKDDKKKINLLITRQPFVLAKKAFEGMDINKDFQLQYYSTKEIFELIKEFNIKRTLFLSIEEEFGLSYDDYKRLDEIYKEFGVVFGYDGLNLKV